MDSNRLRPVPGPMSGKRYSGSKKMSSVLALCVNVRGEGINTYGDLTTVANSISKIKTHNCAFRVRSANQHRSGNTEVDPYLTRLLMTKGLRERLSV
jgi:hypothetical protein